MFSLFIFIFGLSVGSFLNSVIWRLQSGESFLKGRSFCPNCRHTLTWRDLIPLLSFIMLKGRCRYCSQKISWQYPLVELGTAIIFLLTFLTASNINVSSGAEDAIRGVRLNEVSANVYLLIIASFLIVIFVYDLKHYIIPDQVVYPAILVSGIWYLVSGIFLALYTKYEILNAIYSALGASAFFLAIVLVSRGKWMGVGDIKLAFLMGLILGFPDILVALFLAFLLGAIIGIGLIAFRKKTLKSEVPFGPFLVAGTFAALFWGQQIISWYFNLV